MPGTVSVSVCTHCARSASMRLFASGISALAMRTASPEGGDLRHRLGAGAHTLLLPAAENVRRELQPCRMYSAPMPLGAWTLWPLTDIMSAPSVLAENGSLHKALHRVGVEKRPGLCRAQRAGHARDIRHGAGLIVDHHERYERRILPERGTHRIGGYRPGAVGGEKRYLIALARELFRAAFARRRALRRRR